MKLPKLCRDNLVALCAFFPLMLLPPIYLLKEYYWQIAFLLKKEGGGGLQGTKFLNRGGGTENFAWSNVLVGLNLGLKFSLALPRNLWIPCSD